MPEEYQKGKWKSGLPYWNVHWDIPCAPSNNFSFPYKKEDFETVSERLSNASAIAGIFSRNSIEAKYAFPYFKARLYSFFEKKIRIPQDPLW